MNYLLSRNTKEPISREFLDYYGIKYTIQAEINRPKDSKERGTFFNHRLTVPIIENKVLVGLEGRSYNGGSPKVLYPKNSCVDTLLNIDNLNPDEPLYLAEGVFHLPSLFNTGRRNISCTFGASVSAKQISILKKFKEIIYFPDNDDAGERAIETIIKGLNKDSLFICKLPYILNDKGKALDLGDFTAEEIDNFLLNVIPYNDYNYDKVDPFDRKDEISPGKVFLNSLDK
jgi:DNA primase